MGTFRLTRIISRSSPPHLKFLAPPLETRVAIYNSQTTHKTNLEILN